MYIPPAGVSVELTKTYQTLVLQSIVEYLHTGNENVLVTFKGAVFSGSLSEAVGWVGV